MKNEIITDAAQMLVSAQRNLIAPPYGGDAFERGLYAGQRNAANFILRSQARRGQRSARMVAKQIRHWINFFKKQEGQFLPAMVG